MKEYTKRQPLLDIIYPKVRKHSRLKREEIIEQRHLNVNLGTKCALQTGNEHNITLILSVDKILHRCSLLGQPVNSQKFRKILHL